MSGFETRFERLELKYLIDEFTADQIRRHIAPYCRRDEHNREPSGLIFPLTAERGYSISSLYLDSPGLAFHQAKERGDPERLKLRVRSYEGSPEAMLELKRRVNDVIDKSRVAVPRAEVEEIVSGTAPLRIGQREARRFVTRFARIAAESGAEPKLHINYWREAFTSEVDTYARVTFDRQVRAQRTDDWHRVPDPSEWVEFDEHWRPEFRHKNVVLELKCQAFVPWWITDLIRAFALKRQSFSKYSIGIHITGRAAGAGSAPLRSAKVMQ